MLNPRTRLSQSILHTLESGPSLMRSTHSCNYTLLLRHAMLNPPEIYFRPLALEASDKRHPTVHHRQHHPHPQSPLIPLRPRPLRSCPRARLLPRVVAASRPPAAKPCPTSARKAPASAAACSKSPAPTTRPASLARPSVEQDCGDVRAYGSGLRTSWSHGEPRAYISSARYERCKAGHAPTARRPWPSATATSRCNLPCEP